MVSPESEGCGVQEVVLENFKSYEGQVRVGPFKKFTCVVGPNGAGKSNLMDAISFVLGVRTRHLRSDRLQELVHRKEQEQESAVGGRRCSVQLVYFQESGQPGGRKEKTFRRVIQPASEARFQIDGEAVSQEVYLSSLEEINILSKARNFLVFQGDVEAAAQRQGKELTGFLEQVSGSIALRAQYEKLAADKASKEDAARDLFTRKRNAQNEKKRMSQQKEEAARYRALEAERRKLQAEFVLFRVRCAESKAQEVEKSIRDVRAEVDKAQAHRKEAGLELVESEKQRGQVQADLNEVEKRLQAAKGQMATLSPDQIQARSELYAIEKRQQEAAEDRELDLERQGLLRSQATQLTERLSQLDERLERLRERPLMPFSEEQWRQFKRAQEEAERLTGVQSQEAMELEQRLKVHRRQKALAAMDRREADLRVWHLRQKVEHLEASVGLKQKAQESQQAEVEKLSKELEALEEGRRSRGDAKKKLEEERREIMEEIQNITAREHQIEQERRLTQVCDDLAQVVPGVSGRVVSLCEHVQKKFRIAVNVALGGYMDSVIVDSMQHARQCIEHLKDRMMAPLTFLPMDNLRASPDGRLHEALQGQQGLRPALNCVSFEPRLTTAFEFMLADVVVADSLDDARRFVFHELKDLGIKCRVVTLTGETISREGNLAVSSEAKGGLTRFDFSELEGTKARLEAIDNELIELRSKHSVDAVHLSLQDAAKRAELSARDSELQLQNVEAELKARQQELMAAEEGLMQLPGDDPQEETRLLAQLTALQQRIGRATAELFADLDGQLGADVRDMERELRLKREALELEEEALLRQQVAFRAELAMVQRTLSELRREAVAAPDVTALQRRHEGLQQRMKACLEQVDAEAEALQQQRELLKAQEQAVSAARHDLKEKQRDASEAGRRMSILQSELKEVQQARRKLLCQSVLEDVELPVIGSKKESKAALRRLVSMSGESSSGEELCDVRPDYEQLPEERRTAASGGPASQLLEEEYRLELRRLSNELEQLQPNLKAFDQLEQADQEAMAAEREAQRARKRMEAVERNFEEVRCQRREKFMECFHKVQEGIHEVYRRLTKSAAAGFEGGSAFLDLEDLEDPWNAGIKFTAMPPSKRFCDMALLSGGEKTVAAMALLFAIQAFQRPPFLVLDEIDAHLDHSNVSALASFIDSLGCQAIVISQKDRFFSHGEGLVGISKRQNTSVVFTMDLARLRG